MVELMLSPLRFVAQASRVTRLPPAFRRIKIQKRGCAAQSSLLEDLTNRGFVYQVTRPEQLAQTLEASPQTVYAGIDPTAKSLHIGHLIPLLCLLHFQIRGHQIIPLIGGATGRIGDPSGRLVERQLADIQQVEDNIASLTESIQHFFTRALSYASSRTGRDHGSFSDPKITSNLDWHANVTMLDFLRQVGVHARVNTMLNRESVRARLNSQQGISFTEFTYQLLQAYDFYHLYKHRGCTIQIGGSDQWGNIVAGIELAGRLDPSSSSQPDAGAESISKCFGITTPLLTTASGAKFGKSAGNAIWLDSKLSSVYEFYQYFIKADDADVEKFLKLFTLLPLPEIDEIMKNHMQQPERRLAQRRLAEEVTEMVHTRVGLAEAQTVTNILFGSEYSQLKTQDVVSAFKNDPRLVVVEEHQLLETPIVKLAAKHGLVASISAARSLVSSRGLYLNNATIQDPQARLTKAQLIDHHMAIIRAGKDKLLVLTMAP